MSVFGKTKELEREKESLEQMLATAIMSLDSRIELLDKADEVVQRAMTAVETQKSHIDELLIQIVRKDRKLEQLENIIVDADIGQSTKSNKELTEELEATQQRLTKAEKVIVLMGFKATEDAT